MAMTPRQDQILQAIVESYSQSASPVGSLALSEKFGYSPATIRAEMAALEEMNYITHPHTSAGRMPTDKGYRHYVDSLQAKAAAVVRRRQEDRVERAIDQRISAAGEPERALRTAVESLSELTSNVGVGIMGELAYMTGLAHLFANPEFIDAHRVYAVAQLLDNLEPWLRQIAPNQRLSVYIGQESPVGKASGCSLIISRFASPLSDYSYVGVVGPTRQSYPRVIRLVEHVSNQLEEAFHA